MAGLGAGTRSPASMTLYDAGNEPGYFKGVLGVTLTAANFVAQQALWSTLIDAAVAITLGAKAQTTYGDKTTYSWTQPTNGAAREYALLIQWKDTTTGARGSSTLETLNPEMVTYVVNINAKDVIVMDDPTQMADFVTAFNAFNRNPYTGNATMVVGLKAKRGGK